MTFFRTPDFHSFFLSCLAIHLLLPFRLFFSFQSCHSCPSFSVANFFSGIRTVARSNSWEYFHVGCIASTHEETVCLGVARQTVVISGQFFFFRFLCVWRRRRRGPTFTQQLHTKNASPVPERQSVVQDVDLQ